MEATHVEIINYLSVRQHSGIVAIETAVDESLNARLVKLMLLSNGVEDQVEGEGLVLAKSHLRLVRCHGSAHPAHVDHFPRNLRPNATKRKKIKISTLDDFS